MPSTTSAVYQHSCHELLQTRCHFPMHDELLTKLWRHFPRHSVALTQPAQDYKPNSTTFKASFCLHWFKLRFNWFKPSWQKEISASFFGRNLSKHSPHYSAESYSTFIKYSQNYDFVEYLTRINVGICLIDKVGFKVCVLFVHTDYVNCYYLTLNSQMYFSFEIMHILNDSNN